MGIEIKKPGKFIDRKKVDVTCKRCECEFSCYNTDFDKGVIKCPNCNNEIPYVETDTYKTEQTSNIKLTEVKKRLRSEIFETIDFVKIHEHMKNVGWKWAFTQQKDGIPTIQEIEECLGKLIEEAVDRKSTISTGGFTVRYKEFPKDEEGPHTIGVDVVFYVDNAVSDVDVDTLEYVYY